MDQPSVIARRVWSRAEWWTSDAAMFGVMAAATATVWGHTIDEIRIGELSAIPAGALNLGLLVAWGRLGTRSRGWSSLLFGLFWTVTVVPYHVVPLLQGVATWQNFSGLLRVIGGAAMIFAGVRLLLQRRRGDEPNA